MLAFCLIVQFTLAQVALAQQHGSTLDNVLCYDCDHDQGNTFPHCLERPVRCGNGQVCRISHGYRLHDHLPVIKCKNEDYCLHQNEGHTTPCSQGGVKVSSEHCRVCCENSQCVTNVTNVLKLELITSDDLFCPHRCHVDNLKHCVDNGIVCDHGDYCEVKVNNARQVTGDCRDDHLWVNCLKQMHNLPCPDDLEDPLAYNHDTHNHCYSDCCVDNRCLFKRFGIHLANATFPTNQQTPVTSPVTGQGSDLWDKLHGSCVDTFSEHTCEGLRDQSDLCHNRLALSMCPKTCGICGAVQSYVCRDSAELSCSDLVNRSSSYCSTTEAVFACPRTCNVCDKLLDSIVISLLEGTSLSTIVPPNLLPSPSTLNSGPTVSYPTVNCDDIRSVTCDHVVPICMGTFLGEVCPDQCGACLAETSP